MSSRILRLWNPNTSAWEEVGDSRLSTHLAASDPHPGYVLETLADAKGDLLAASGADTLARLAAGTDGQVLTADAAQTLGVRWATPTSGGMTDPTTTKGDLIARGASAPATRLAVGTDGQVLTADAAQTLGVRWATATGLTQAAADALYLNVAGDTATGTIFAPALGAGAGVALVSRVYGTGTAGFTSSESTGNYELGVRFSTAVAGTLAEVRWYRNGTSTPTPTTVRLWDTTTSGVVWTAPAGDLGPFSNTAQGWKTATITTPFALVAGRDYVLALAATSNYSQAPSYTPTPDAPVTFVGHRYANGAGTYPTTSITTAFLIDPGVATAAGALAATGAVRLPNGANGAVAWRNAANSADLALTVNASDQLTFNGAALLSQTTAASTYLALAGGTLTGDLVLSEATPSVGLKLAADTQPRSRLTDTALAFGPGGTAAPDATLQRTGAGALRVDTNLGVGVTPEASWATSTYPVLRQGAGGALWSSPSGSLNTYWSSNIQFNGTVRQSLGSGPLAEIAQEGGVLNFKTNTTDASGVQTVAPSTRMSLAKNGTLTLTPDATVPALVAQGNLGVGVNPAAWHTDRRAMQLGQTAALLGHPTSNYVELVENSYLDSGATQRALVANASSRLYLSAGGLTVQTAPSVGAGAAQTFTARAVLNNVGTLTLTPDAGQNALASGAWTISNTGGGDSNSVQLFASTYITLNPGGNYVLPERADAINLGSAARRWAAVYAVNGTIQTSAADQKTDITPLDPAAAMAAVRATTPCTFDYLTPERSADWYELPDDPEQAATVLEQRLVADPLEAGARHQAGVVLGSPDFPCDPLFQTGTGQTNPSNGVGVLIAALQSLDQRVTSLGG